MDVSVGQPGALLSELLSDCDPPPVDCHLGKTQQQKQQLPADLGDLNNSERGQLRDKTMVDQISAITDARGVSEQDRNIVDLPEAVCDFFSEKVMDHSRFPVRPESQQQTHIDEPMTTVVNSVSSQAAALAAAAMVKVSAERSMNTPFSLTQRPSTNTCHPVASANHRSGEKASECRPVSTETAITASEHSPPNKEQLLQQEINYLSDPKLNMVTFADLKYWCTVFYYELNTRVGDSFQAAGQALTVDGFTEPCYRSDRFSLGSLSQVNRPMQVEKTRRYIGRGLKLLLVGTTVHLECLSDAAIFAQSPSCNHFNNWHPATVVKVPPQCNLLLFDSRTFAKQLIECISRGYESVFALTHMCAVRISFVKGWGAEYRRQTITSTPCWIEVHLNGPLKWLDRVLRQIGSPTVPCTSSS